MDLKEFLSQHPGFKLAGPSDNEALLKFFSQASISGKTLQLRMDRSPDFFRLLKLQGDTAYVFVYEPSPGEISGVATVVLRDGYVHGKRVRVGYLGDLRSRFERESLRKWRGMFFDVLSGKIDEFGDCRYWITAVIDENRLAQKVLVNPKRGQHTYDVLSRYEMVNVFARPFLARAVRGIEVTRASSNEISALDEFLNEQNRTQAFGFHVDLARRLVEWPDFKIENFLVARVSGKIVGCTALWSPSAAKRIIVDRIPRSLRLLSSVVPVPGAGEVVQTLYLCNLTIAPDCDRGRVFRALFDEAYRSRPAGTHMVSFCDFSVNQFRKNLGPYLMQRIPMTLYSVRAKAEAEEIWKPKELLAPGFEMALV